jgi:hypothetical protein
MSSYLSTLSSKVKGKGNGFDYLNCRSCRAQRTTGPSHLADFENQIKEFRVKGSVLNNFPESSFVRITDNNRTVAWYTILKNTTHYNVASLFEEVERIDHTNQNLEFHRGFIGSHPNMFFTVDINDTADFLSEFKRSSSNPNRVLGIKGQVSRVLISDYAVGRYHKDFWKISDQANDAFRSKSRYGLNNKAGMFDLSRYMNVYN